MNSLRARAFVWGLGLALVSVLAGGIILFSLFDGIAVRRFDEQLEGQHLQVVVALATAGPDAAGIARLIADPAYDRPRSGKYWQVSNNTGVMIVSRSLLDSLLSVPRAPSSELVFSTVPGPDGPIRLATQKIALEGGTEWIVVAGRSLAAISRERAETRNILILTFSLVSLLGLGNALLQTSAVLRPLATLRKDILSRWDTNEALDPKDYPDEVAPLVVDINTLLRRNHDLFDQTRRQGADLAHALKTPSAILRNELDSLRQSGGDTRQALEALDRMDAQIMRSLARLRAVNAAAIALPRTPVLPSVERLVRLFQRLPEGKETTFTYDVDPRHKVAMDHQDLEELIGNLLDNAVKWRRERVALSIVEENALLKVLVEDDGPGIDEHDREAALRPGGRLDESSIGTGLGLAIAKDLVEAYGGTMDLGRSDSLGGLRATIALPTRGVIGPAKTGGTI